MSKDQNDRMNQVDVWGTGEKAASAKALRQSGGLDHVENIEEGTVVECGRKQEMWSVKCWNLIL